MFHVKQRYPLQILAALQCQCRAGLLHKAILMQQGAMQIAFRRFAVADGDVHGALAEIDPLDAGMQAQIDGGNSALKSAVRGTSQWVRKLEVVVTVSAGGCRRG